MGIGICSKYSGHVSQVYQLSTCFPSPLCPPQTIAASCETCPARPRVAASLSTCVPRSKDRPEARY